ncbi:MAG: hypothetical protein ABSG87_11125 [Verrucomicrobiota bacterium]
MPKAMILTVLFSLCLLAGNDPIREVTSQARRDPFQMVPAFYQGYFYLIGNEGADSVTIFAPDGHLAMAFAEAAGHPRAIAVDTDGTVAVAWGDWDPKKGGGIDFRDSSGSVTRTIKTGLYLPHHLAFAEDHSLWSFGCEMDAASVHGNPKHEYQTVRKYGPDGKEAGAYLPRSLFPTGLEPASQGFQWNSITVAHDRIGLWAVSGTRGSQTEWVELDLNGNLTGRWRLDQFGLNPKLALTRDGSFFVQVWDDQTRTHQFYTLDRASSEWRAVDTAPSGWLEGADGDALVFRDGSLGPMHLQWYRHP